MRCWPVRWHDPPPAVDAQGHPSPGGLAMVTGHWVVGSGAGEVRWIRAQCHPHGDPVMIRRFWLWLSSGSLDAVRAEPATSPAWGSIWTPGALACRWVDAVRRGHDSAWFSRRSGRAEAVLGPAVPDTDSWSAEQPDSRSERFRPFRTGVESPGPAVPDTGSWSGTTGQPVRGSGRSGRAEASPRSGRSGHRFLVRGTAGQPVRGSGRSGRAPWRPSGTPWRAAIFCPWCAVLVPDRRRSSVGSGKKQGCRRSRPPVVGDSGGPGFVPPRPPCWCLTAGRRPGLAATSPGQ